MTPFAELLQQGAANAWFFVPTAILLGALHGLEPGHSKTMMAGFIVAVRGTAAQAVLLGLAATVSHTAIVWAIAIGGMYLWLGTAPEAFEPWLQLVSGLVIVAMALWMLHRARAEASGRPHGHGHNHPHDHAPDAGDAHARAHADDISRRFAGRHVSTAQIVGFGLTGGLIPCPAAITVLLLCLQFDAVTLGAGLVLAFSVGLALTLVAVGVAAAWSVAHASKNSSWFATLAQRAPYLSGALLVAVGIYVTLHGWTGIAG